MTRQKYALHFPLWVVPGILALLLVACGNTENGATAPTYPTQIPVNGFGVAANHVHTLLSLPNHVLLLATHYGTFRSEDSGKTWRQVSGAGNQLMQGVMNFSLVASPFTTQRLYLLTQPQLSGHAAGVGILGLYTSGDQGRTWRLVSKQTDFTTALDGVTFATVGNTTPDEVYIYVRTQSTHGLKISRDNGKHFSDTGTLPFGNITDMIAPPGVAGELLIYGSDGMARSADGGLHWQVLQSITSSIFTMATAGPRSPIYASGDEGTYSSRDGGKTFTRINNEYRPNIVVSPSQPQTLYTHDETNVYRSANGGKTWDVLPAVKGNHSSIAVDTENAAQIFLSLSYPVEVYGLDQNNTAWTSLTPKT